MSKAWFALWVGVCGLIVGAVMVGVDGAVGIGFVVSAVGLLIVTGAAVVLAQPWLDPVDKEIEAWERDWTASWSPVCPVHRDQMCYVRTRNCPPVRERIDS